ncbi:MAG: DUF2461 domain-containing protein [Oscillospiraceae bacterium]|nr:DUF2461 domain-containing protein [Oscillospiraceae bacterium]
MFEGFSEKTSEFLWDLKFNNERPWFLAHKEEFLKNVKEPFDALGKDLLEEMRCRFPGEDWNLHISRIYRDARRLFGRGPYKDHLWLTLWKGLPKGDNPAFWFEISPEAYACGTGFWAAEASQMEAYRKYIDTNPAEILRLDAMLKNQNRFVMRGEMYKRPKADKGEPLNQWYNRRWLGFEHFGDYSPELYSANLVQTLADGFEFLMPYYDLMCKFIR